MTNASVLTRTANTMAMERPKLVNSFILVLAPGLTAARCESKKNGETLLISFYDSKLLYSNSVTLKMPRTTACHTTTAESSSHRTKPEWHSQNSDHFASCLCESRNTTPFKW